MKKWVSDFTISVASTVLLSGLVAPLSASAVTASDWRAGRIIDDAVFTNSGSMTVDQIQAFLNQKVGTGGYGRVDGQCDTNGVGTSEFGGGTRAQYGASNGNPAPFTCLKDYYEVPKTAPGPGVPASNYGGAPIPVGARSAAQLIWDAAQRYSISPKVLLVTIQKESAGPLTTDDWPFRSQYTYAMGAYCPDSGPGGSANCDPNYAGFSIQISESAELLRWYIDSMDQPWWSYKKPGNNSIQYNPNTSCGSSNVYIENKATAALYTYTPYQPNQAALNNMYGSGDGCSAYGNRNFWRIYNDWFGSPTGTFLQKGSGPTVYVVADGKKYGIPSGAMLSAYGFSNIGVTAASDAYLASLQDNGTLTSLFSTPNDPTVYLVDNGKKYGIPSGAYCAQWALPCGNTTLQKNLPAQIANLLIDGGTLQPLMNYQGTVFRLTNGTKEPFLSPLSLFEHGFGWGNVTPITSQINSSQVMGNSLPQNMSLVKFSSSQGFYFYTNGGFYAIPDFNTYKSWFSHTDYIFSDSVSSYNATLPTPIGTISNYVMSEGKNYIIDDGRRLEVTKLTIPYSPQDSTFIQPYLDRLPTLQILDKSVIWTPSGAIYSIDNSKKRPIYSMNDFFALGNVVGNVVGVNTASSSLLPDGDVLYGPGTLLKTSDSAAIYAVGNGNKLYVLSRYEDLFNFGFDTSRVVSVTSTTINSFSLIDALHNLVTDQSGNRYLINGEGKRIPFSSTSLNNWGVGGAAVSDLSDYVLARVPKVNINPVFARDTSGTIYMGEGGTKHPISYYQKYLELGGNSTNTFSGSVDFLASSPTGSTY